MKMMGRIQTLRAQFNFIFIIYLGPAIFVTFLLIPEYGANTAIAKNGGNEITLYKEQGYSFYLPLIGRPCIPTIFGQVSDDENKETNTLNAINEKRAANGLPALVVAIELTQSARFHSHDMANNNFTGHTGSNGSFPGDRMSQACYHPYFAGEIIGWGFGGNINSMINWWMNSEPHRLTILSEDYVDFGAGFAKNSKSKWGNYWTVNFGSRANPSTVAGSANGMVYICTETYLGDQGGVMVIIQSPDPCD